MYFATYYIKLISIYIYIYILLYISDVKFINGTAIINFNSKYSRDRFLDLKFDNKYDKLFISHYQY